MPSFEGSADDIWLVRARHRAEELRTCVDSWRGPPYLDPRDAAHATFVDSCPAANLTYVHVFKSAGTTLKNAVRALCNRTGHLARVYPGWQSVTSEPSTLDDVSRTTVFTFVREPVSRFQSALFEISRPVQTKPWIRQTVRDAFEQNRTVASVAIDYLLANRDKPIANVHLQPQVAFLTHMGRALPLKYVGVFSPLLRDELGAIVADAADAASSSSTTPSLSSPASKENIGTSASSSFGRAGVAAKAALDDIMSHTHLRNHLDWNHSEGALVGPFGSIYDEPLDADTRAKITDYYRVDYECLGLNP